MNQGISGPPDSHIEQKALHIVFAADQHYLQHFTVACTSLLENNALITGRIFLLHDLGNLNELSSISEFFEEKYSKKIEPIRVPATVFKDYFISIHLSHSTYFRYLIPDLLPEGIERVLFLDSDLIIHGDIGELIALDFKTRDDEYDLFAVDHHFNSEGLEDMELRFGSSFNKYFNAGVILINLRRWRERKISGILCRNTETFMDRLKYHDQDILNYTFNNRWGLLDDIYNYREIARYNDHIKTAKIIHYSGDSKPWHYLNDHPGKYLYWHYLKKTPFKGFVPNDKTFSNKIKRALPKSFKFFLKRIIASLGN